jgi:pSer/pThr/pTyr-binding forkhead associated (FHA) protein
MNPAIDHRELSFKALAGLIGGALGWLPIELVSHGHTLTEQPTMQSVVASFISMAIMSGLLGGLIIAADAQTLELTSQVKRSFLRGFVICFILSLPATYYSNLAFASILQSGGWAVNQGGSFVYLIVGRVISWAMMGTMLGAGVGLASFSLKNLLKGAAGGWIGGFLGGLVFDPLGLTLGGGLPSRLIGFSVVGLAIGLLIGLVHQLTKNAWLRVEAGRLKGRQFRLEGAAATVGRAEENVVGLFGDPRVQPRHAIINHQGERYEIKNLAVQEGTLVNGRRIETVELSDADQIQIGDYLLSFHLRAKPGEATLLSAVKKPSTYSPATRLATSQASATPHLIDQTGQIFPLKSGGPTNLGRALDNDIVVSHPSVSRYHASVIAVDGGFALRDLNSRNGTYIRDERVQEARIADGDSIRLGDAAFTFRA